MQDLKTEDKLVKIVDYNAIDDFISFHYGVPYEIVAEEELSNYSYKMVKVESGPLNQWEQSDLDALKQERHYAAGINVLMKDLCNRGFLAEGNYLIHVFW